MEGSEECFGALGGCCTEGYFAGLNPTGAAPAWTREGYVDEVGYPVWGVVLVDEELFGLSHVVEVVEVVGQSAQETFGVDSDVSFV